MLIITSGHEPLPQPPGDLIPVVIHVIAAIVMVVTVVEAVVLPAEDVPTRLHAVDVIHHGKMTVAIVTMTAETEIAPEALTVIER